MAGDLGTTNAILGIIAAVSVLGAPALAASARPLADVMAHVLGDRGAMVVAAIAVITTTNTTLLALTAASRVTYGMAKASALPGAFARVHRTRRTPIRAIATVAVFAFIQAWNQYLWPLLVTNDDSMRTVQIGIATLRTTELARANAVLAATMIAFVPMLLMVIVFQRFLVRDDLSARCGTCPDLCNSTT